jgi:hypothetical protein
MWIHLTELQKSRLSNLGGLDEETVTKGAALGRESEKADPNRRRRGVSRAVLCECDQWCARRERGAFPEYWAWSPSTRRRRKLEVKEPGSAIVIRTCNLPVNRAFMLGQERRQPKG